MNNLHRKKNRSTVEIYMHLLNRIHGLLYNERAFVDTLKVIYCEEENNDNDFYDIRIRVLNIRIYEYTEYI